MVPFYIEIYRISFISSIFLNLLISSIDSISIRDGILEVTFAEIQAMNNENDTEYLNQPLIITNSPMTNWTLYSSLTEIYDSNFDISCKQIITDCNCINHMTATTNNDNTNNKLCKELGSSFLYTSDERNYEHYELFEGEDKLSYPYKQCIELSESNIRIKKLNQLIQSNSLPSNTTQNIDELNPNIFDSKKNEYTKLYSYYNILSMEGQDEENIDSIQLNILDRISLFPYLRIFNLNGYQDINDIHLWFGTQYYRAIRHYDKPNNIFFIIKGSRIFKISPPTSTIFPLHPFGHQSNRQVFLFFEF